MVGIAESIGYLEQTRGFFIEKYLSMYVSIRRLKVLILRMIVFLQ